MALALLIYQPDALGRSLRLQATLDRLQEMSFEFSDEGYWGGQLTATIAPQPRESGDPAKEIFAGDEVDVADLDNTGLTKTVWWRGIVQQVRFRRFSGSYGISAIGLWEHVKTAPIDKAFNESGDQSSFANLVDYVNHVARMTFSRIAQTPQHNVTSSRPWQNKDYRGARFGDCAEDFRQHLRGAAVYGVKLVGNAETFFCDERSTSVRFAIPRDRIVGDPEEVEDASEVVNRLLIEASSDALPRRVRLPADFEESLLDSDATAGDVTLWELDKAPVGATALAPTTAADGTVITDGRTTRHVLSDPAFYALQYALRFNVASATAGKCDMRVGNDFAVQVDKTKQYTLHVMVMATSGTPNFHFVHGVPNAALTQSAAQPVTGDKRWRQFTYTFTPAGDFITVGVRFDFADGANMDIFFDSFILRKSGTTLGASSNAPFVLSGGAPVFWINVMLVGRVTGIVDLGGGNSRVFAEPLTFTSLDLVNKTVEFVWRHGNSVSTGTISAKSTNYFECNVAASNLEPGDIFRVLGITDQALTGLSSAQIDSERTFGPRWALIQSPEVRNGTDAQRVAQALAETFALAQTSLVAKVSIDPDDPELFDPDGKAQILGFSPAIDALALTKSVYRWQHGSLTCDLHLGSKEKRVRDALKIFSKSLAVEKRKRDRPRRKD